MQAAGRIQFLGSANPVCFLHPTLLPTAERRDRGNAGPATKRPAGRQPPASWRRRPAARGGGGVWAAAPAAAPAAASGGLPELRAVAAAWQAAKASAGESVQDGLQGSCLHRYAVVWHINTVNCCCVGLCARPEGSTVLCRSARQASALASFQASALRAALLHSLPPSASSSWAMAPSCTCATSATRTTRLITSPWSSSEA